MSESKPIRVVTVDDHEVVRGGIKFALLAAEDIELVGEAHNGEDALSQCEQLQPDVVLMDLMMPGMDGVAAIQSIRKQFPQTQILVLTSYHDEVLVPRAMHAGATGYLLKGVSNQKLIEAIRAAYAGQPTMAREAVDDLVEAAAPSNKPDIELSERERQVLTLLAQGLSNKEIADQLFFSVSTVKYHVRVLFSKLGVNSRAEVIALAWEHNLIEK